MISSRMLLSALVLTCVPAIALAQNKDNKALQQLKDTKQSSQEAAGTRNPEAAKAKSNQGFDTAQPPSVRAGAPSTQSKAERDAAAIKAYTSEPATGTTQIQAIQRKKLAEPPSPVTAATTPKATPAKTAAPTTPAKIAAPIAPAKPAAPVAAAPSRPTPVAAAPARVAAPVAAAPVKPSTTTFTTSSAPSSSSSSSSASKPSSSSSKK